MDSKRPELVTITRESLLDDAVRIRLQQQYQSVPFLTPEQQRDSLTLCLRHWCGTAPVYVFAYGSLIWNPAIHCEAVGTGRLFGRHRRMAMRSIFGRGTPECPGLMLTLLPGGCCDGVVLKIEPSRAFEELSLLWRREMISGSYRPRWMPVRTAKAAWQCLVFDHNPHHPSFVGPLAFEREVQILSQAHGPLGPNKDYIFQTVQALDRWQLRDARMSRLEKALRACELQGIKAVANFPGE
jgi:cation transport protein ChaC